MHRAAAGLIAFAGELLAHPGHHGATDGHFHGWGFEHALLFAATLVALGFALRQK